MKRKTPRTGRQARIVFLFDVDNTLLDNDGVTADLKRYLEREVGRAGAQCYWKIFERLRGELGYADYLGALRRYRGEKPHEPHLLAVSRFLIHGRLPEGLCHRIHFFLERCSTLGRQKLFSRGQ